MVVQVTAEQSTDADGHDVFTLTSVIDNRAHKVIDSELCAQQSAQTGRFAALCGHLVTPAPLVEADGAPCSRCAELAPAPEPPRQRRPRRRGWGLRRLLAV